MPSTYVDIDDLLDEQVLDHDLDAVLDIPGALAAEEREHRKSEYYRNAFYRHENV